MTRVNVLNIAMLVVYVLTTIASNARGEIIVGRGNISSAQASERKGIDRVFSGRVSEEVRSRQEEADCEKLKCRGQKPLRLSPRLIREIASRHARFAATLANFNLSGFQCGVYEVYWTPVAISSKDIEAFLNRKKHGEYFRKYNEEAQRINEQIINGEATEIVYKVRVKQEKSKEWEIKLEVERAGRGEEEEAEGRELEIELREGRGGILRKSKRASWRIN